MIRIRAKRNDRQIDISFPIDESDLLAKMTELYAADSIPAQAFVTEVYEPVELSRIANQDIDLDELNYLAKRINSFSKKEMDQFLTAQHHLSCDLKKLINLTFNLNKFTLIQDISSMGAVGKAYLLNERGCLPSYNDNETNYAVIGRELIESGRGIFTERGLLFIDDKPMEEVYDGQVFPAYDYSGASLVSAEIEYNGKVETVYLPDEDIAITKALKRLGAKPDSDYVIGLDNRQISMDAWMDKIQSTVNTEGIFAANELLRVLDSECMEWDKLLAVMEYVGTERPSDIAILADCINRFEFISGAETEEDVAHYFIDNYDQYYLNINLEEFFNYAEFGEHIADEYDGKFVDGGFVCSSDGNGLDDIFELLEDNDEFMTMEM